MEWISMEKALVMKTLLFILLFATNATAQITELAKQKYDWKRAIAPASLCFVSGAAWGLHESTAHHWPKFQARFPNANPGFWNPAVSHEMKAAIGYKFDAKHLLASTTQVTGFAAGFTIAIGQKRPWWHYALDAGIGFGAYTLGNAITWDLIYR